MNSTLRASEPTTWSRIDDIIARSIGDRAHIGFVAYQIFENHEGILHHICAYPTFYDDRMSLINTWLVWTPDGEYFIDSLEGE